jgi:hypothetical protein
MHRIFVLKKVVQKVNTHLSQVHYYAVYESCKKYGTAREAKEIFSDLI